MFGTYMYNMVTLTKDNIGQNQWVDGWYTPIKSQNNPPPPPFLIMRLQILFTKSYVRNKLIKCDIIPDT